MFLALIALIGGAAAGGAWVAHRLKGSRTWREAMVVVLGGGPGNPTTPV